MRLRRQPPAHEGRDDAGQRVRGAHAPGRRQRLRYRPGRADDAARPGAAGRDRGGEGPRRPRRGAGSAARVKTAATQLGELRDTRMDGCGHVSLRLGLGAVARVRCCCGMFDSAGTLASPLRSGYHVWARRKSLRLRSKEYGEKRPGVALRLERQGLQEWRHPFLWQTATLFTISTPK